MGKKTMNGEARGRDIHDGKERTLAKLQPTQLALFQMFLPEDDKYSNTNETSPQQAAGYQKENLLRMRHHGFSNSSL